MDILLGILRLTAAILVAILLGKCVAKLKLPAILGWLLTGMLLGPFAFNVLDSQLLDASWYKAVSHFFECAVGLMFAKELVFKKLKSLGKQIMTITIFEAMGTFLVVSVAFSVLFYFMGIPLYVALVFGGIALATAPAPSLSIVNEFKTKGPITNTLIPITMLDDVIAMIVFFTVNSYVASLGSTSSGSVLTILASSIALPVGLGIGIGFAVSLLFKKEMSQSKILCATLFSLAMTFGIAYAIDHFVLATPIINYMLLGMATFTTLANLVPEHTMTKIANSVSPVVGIGLMLMIINLGAPLDYRLILGAGLLTTIYIISRAFGKYFSTYLGAHVSNAEPTVKKYLGFVLLPHSGVSLVFTGMAVASLSTFDTESAVLVQGTIAAAAVINEIIAVIIAKKGFEWGGELSTTKAPNPDSAVVNNY